MYYQQPTKEVKQLPLEFAIDHKVGEMPMDNKPTGMVSTGAPINALFFFWVAGLVAWCVVFANPKGQTQRKRRKKGMSGKDV